MPAVQLTDRGSGAAVSTESRDLTRAAVAALGAPSILDTQPWHWRIGHDTADLRADRSRQPATIDPAGRLLTISCGIALHHAHTALHAAGHQTDIAYLPDDTDPDLLATVRIHGTAATTGNAVRLFRAMAARHHDQRPVDTRPVHDDTLRRLHDAAEEHGAHLHLPGSSGQGTGYALLYTDSDEPRDWLTAGVALSAVLLTATADGLSPTILDDPTETASSRDVPLGHPMVAIRIGHPIATAPQRSAHDVLDHKR